jgi:hypothetical protein
MVTYTYAIINIIFIENFVYIGILYIYTIYMYIRTMLNILFCIYTK